MVAIAVVIVRFGPALSFTAALAMPAFDAWIAGWTNAPTIEEIAVRTDAAAVHADVYRSRHARAAVVLVHGLSPAGRRHPELARLARLFARHGYLVMVPQFDGLAKFRLSGREIDEITAAIDELRRRHDRVAVAGFSFGAGPALIAAAKHDSLAWVGSFGGYADLTNVIVFLTTGVHRWQGRRHSGPVEEYNRWKLLALLAPLVQDERDRERLLVIASRRLANPFDDVSAIVVTLGPDGRTVMSLVESRQEDVTRTLLGRLSPATRTELDRLSVTAAVPRLHTRLWLVHGTADDSIPFTESLRLADAAGARARAVILESFHHTGPASTWTRLHRRATDATALFLLVDDILKGAR